MDSLIRNLKNGLDIKDLVSELSLLTKKIILSIETLNDVKYSTEVKIISYKYLLDFLINELPTSSVSNMHSLFTYSDNCLTLEVKSDYDSGLEFSQEMY